MKKTIFLFIIISFNIVNAKDLKKKIIQLICNNKAIFEYSRNNYPINASNLQNICKLKREKCLQAIKIFDKKTLKRLLMVCKIESISDFNMLKDDDDFNEVYNQIAKVLKS